MEKNKRHKMFKNEFTEGIIDIESARTLSLKEIELDLPDPETFAKEKFRKIIRNCNLDEFNADSMHEYITSYAGYKSGIKDALEARKQTANQLVDQYTEFFASVDAGLVPVSRNNDSRGAITERKTKKAYLNRVAPISPFLDPVNKWVIIFLTSIAEIVFLFIIIQGIIYQNPLLTIVATISATICLVVLPAILGYELSNLLVNDSTTLSRHNRLQLMGSVIAYALIYIAYASLRLGSVEILQNSSVASKNVLIMLSVLFMILPLINSLIIFKIHFYEATSSEVENRRNANNEYECFRAEKIKQSLPTIDEYRARLNSQLQELEAIAYSNLDKWIAFTENCWRLALAENTGSSPEAVDKIFKK